MKIYLNFSQAQSILTILLNQKSCQVNYPLLVRFVCPANEHWGVVVHEAAAAGLPLLLSNTTYAGTHFLVEGINGYSFDENNYKDLKIN